MKYKQYLDIIRNLRIDGTILSIDKLFKIKFYGKKEKEIKIKKV